MDTKLMINRLANCKRHVPIVCRRGRRNASLLVHDVNVASREDKKNKFEEGGKKFGKKLGNAGRSYILLVLIVRFLTVGGGEEMPAFSFTTLT
jgi:hypothetical protein